MSSLLSKLSNCIFCQNNYKLNSYNLCIYCEEHLNKLVLNQNCVSCTWPVLNHDYCSLCIEQQNFKFYNKTIAFAYLNPIDKLIHQLKYNNLEHMRTNFALCILSYKLLENIKTYYHTNKLVFPQAIIPIPIHNLKLKQRGFNQTIEIARILAKNLNLKLEANIISKFKNTVAQATLDRQQRISNLEHSFCLNNKLKYSSVAIVDDVVTTGATVHTVARLLNNIGIENISLWAVARRV
jgi:ComF family protein